MQDLLEMENINLYLWVYWILILRTPQVMYINWVGKCHYMRHKMQKQRTRKFNRKGIVTFNLIFETVKLMRVDKIH